MLVNLLSPEQDNYQCYLVLGINNDIVNSNYIEYNDKNIEEEFNYIGKTNIQITNKLHAVHVK